ncbi:MAG: hypothetical protein AAGA92_09140 [Planctomycetota bacterium]
MSDQALPPEDPTTPDGLAARNDRPVCKEGPVREEMLIAYLMNGLPEAEHARVEALVAAHPELKEKLDRIRSCLGDGAAPDSPAAGSTPPRLAGKTCRLVGRIRRGFEPSPALSESNDGHRRRPRASLLDWVFVGGIAASVVLLVAPAVQHSRDEARRAQCQDNLREVTHHLLTYLDDHQSLPHIEQHENAGSFALELARNNPHLRELLKTRLVCPSSELADQVAAGAVVMRLPTDAQLAAAPVEEVDLLRRFMSGSYAYRIGYVKDGKYRRIDFRKCGRTPILADAPTMTPHGFHSLRHDACGFNMAMLDGSVQFRDRCAAPGSDSHIFLNTDGDHRAGLAEDDIVLARSEVEPLPRVTPAIRGPAVQRRVPNRGGTLGTKDRGLKATAPW